MTSITCDPEFEVLRPSFPMLNCCVAGGHVPEIERYICTLKDCTQSAYNVLPFKNLPRVLLVHLHKNCTLWLNAFPAANGVSSVHSPHFLLVGWELSIDKHTVLEFGSYVQTHEEHSNRIEPQTMGAICFGPTGNAQGGHWFFFLMSGCCVVRHHWTTLPMPQEVILRVSQIGCAQGMPSHITYANRWGDEISDRLDDFFDNDDDDGSSSERDDDTYMDSGSHQDSEDDGTTVSNNETKSYDDDDDDDDSQGNPDPVVDDKTTGSNDETTSSDVDDDDNLQGNHHPPANETDDPAVPDPAGSLNPMGPDDNGDEGHGDANGAVNTDIPVVDGIEGSIGEGEEWEGECESDASSSVASSEVPPTESEQFEAAEAASRTTADSHILSTESELFEAAEEAGRAAASSHDDTRWKSNHGE